MTAIDLKIGDIITNISGSCLALTAKVKSINIQGKYIIGKAEILSLRRGIKWSDLLDNECRFKYNIKTDLKKILV